MTRSRILFDPLMWMFAAVMAVGVYWVNATDKARDAEQISASEQQLDTAKLATDGEGGAEDDDATRVSAEGVLVEDVAASDLPVERATASAAAGVQNADAAQPVKQADERTNEQTPGTLDWMGWDGRPLEQKAGRAEPPVTPEPSQAVHDEFRPLTANTHAVTESAQGDAAASEPLAGVVQPSAASAASSSDGVNAQAVNQTLRLLDAQQAVSEASLAVGISADSATDAAWQQRLRLLREDPGAYFWGE